MTGKYIWTICQGLFFLYAQIWVMPMLSIWGVIPNVILPWMIYTIWKKPWVMAISTSFFIGILYDVSYPPLFGLQSLVFMLLAIVIDLIRIPFEEQSVVARMITLGVVNMLYASMLYLAFGLQNGFDGTLLTRSLWGFIYNLISSLAIFWLMIFLSKLRIIAVHE